MQTYDTTIEASRAQLSDDVRAGGLRENFLAHPCVPSKSSVNAFMPGVSTALYPNRFLTRAPVLFFAYGTQRQEQ